VYCALLFYSVLVILGGKSGRRKGGVGPIADLLLEKKERKKKTLHLRMTSS
jgi:hypothetical protein